MVSSLKKLYLVVLVLFLLVLGGCTKYVCYDGSVENREGECPVFEEPRIVQRQAENAVDVYSSAYAQALGARHHRVTTYREDSDWFSEVIFTSVHSNKVNHVTLKIDGVTSSVVCVEGCEYLSGTDVEEVNETIIDAEENGGPGFSVI